MTTCTKTLTALLAALGLATLVAAADEPPAKPAPAPAAAPKTLTVEQLGQMLENLGLTPEPYNGKDGQLAGYTVKFPFGEWSMVLNVTLSQDRTHVWFYAPLRKLTDPGAVPPAALLKLLASNGALGLAFFSYTESGGMLYLEMPVPVEGLTAAVLRKQIDFLAATIRDTADQWDPARWKKPATPPAGEPKS